MEVPYLQFSTELIIYEMPNEIHYAYEMVAKFYFTLYIKRCLWMQISFSSFIIAYRGPVNFVHYFTKVKGKCI